MDAVGNPCVMMRFWVVVCMIIICQLLKHLGCGLLRGIGAHMRVPTVLQLPSAVYMYLWHGKLEMCYFAQ